jgi:hypothetical protein
MKTSQSLELKQVNLWNERSQSGMKGANLWNENEPIFGMKTSQSLE